MTDKPKVPSKAFLLGKKAHKEGITLPILDAEFQAILMEFMLKTPSPCMKDIHALVNEWWEGYES